MLAKSVVAVFASGTYGTLTTRTAMSGSTVYVGGGISPIFVTCFVSITSGTSVTAVAVNFMPGSRENASAGYPMTVNFVPLGILNSCFLPSSRVRITDSGGFTCQTVPVTFLIVVITPGVDVVFVVCSIVIPARDREPKAAGRRRSLLHYLEHWRNPLFSRHHPS